MARLTTEQNNEFTFPGKMPLLHLQDAVISPLMRVQLTALRSFSQAAVQQALSSDRLIFLTAPRENPAAGPDDD